MASKKISEVKLNWDEINGAAQRGASLEELCAIAGLDKAYFRRAVKHYQHQALHRYLTRHRLIGEYMIKQAQFELGVTDKNPSMLKWLGVQRLGQRANVVNEELNKGAPVNPESIPSGYEILTPSAAVLQGPQAAIDVTPRPHEEKPAVAAIIEAEIVGDIEKEPTPPMAVKVISGHTGEEL